MARCSNCNASCYKRLEDAEVAQLTQVHILRSSVLQRVAACCGVLQRVAVCCGVLQCVAACCSNCNASCYKRLEDAGVAQLTQVDILRSSVLQCVAACCSVLQQLQR